jgi:hypothetical protein
VRAPALACLIGVATALAAAVGLGSPPAAPFAQGKRAPAAKIAPFNGSLDEAYVRASDRNVPALLVAIVETDDAEHDDVAAFRKEVLTSAALADACRLAVVVLANNKVHKLAEVESGDPPVKRQVCSVYRTEGCGSHQKQFDAIYREYQDSGGELRSPAVIVVGPDRKLAAQWQTGTAPAIDEIVGALAAVRAKAGEGLTEAQLADVRAAMRRAGEAEAKKDPGEGHRAWSAVLAITQKTRYADEARAGCERALAGLTAALDAARAAVREGRAVEGYQALLALATAAAGTPLEKDVKKEVLAVETGKATKDAIAAYKRELEAEALWREAEALASKDAKKAEAKLRLLIRKYADTRAGKRARDAHPEWAAEEDAKTGTGGS